jgi:hypothetical protein
MADEPTSSGWLPPRAPGAEPPPRYEPAPPEPEPEPGQEPARPAFVQGRPADSNGLATTSLVLGLIGLLLLLPSGGLLSLPCSIYAWRTGVQARRRIATGVTSAGEGTAQAGRILGIVGVVAGAIVLTTLIVLLAAGVDLEELRRDLEERSKSGRGPGGARPLTSAPRP